LGTGPVTSPEAVSLSHLRGRDGSAAQRIIAEALRWPGVERAAGHLGSVALLFDQRELGHLHGDVVADVPLPHGSPLGEIEDAAASVEQRESPARGWVSVSLDTEQGMQNALALLRDNYKQASRRSVADDREDP